MLGCLISIRFDGAAKCLLYFALPPLPLDPGVLLLTMLKFSASDAPLLMTLAVPPLARGLLLPALRNKPTNDALFLRGVIARAPGDTAFIAPAEALKVSSFDDSALKALVAEKRALTNDFSSSS